MSKRKIMMIGALLCVFLSSLGLDNVELAADTSMENARAQEQKAELSISEDITIKDWNNRIRREKFDCVLPVAMRNNNVDMWIHVMRLSIPDEFGAQELGSTSGIFVFTDRGGDRIERAVLGRRWGATQREWGDQDYKLVEECGAYDIIDNPIFVKDRWRAR